MEIIKVGHDEDYLEEGGCQAEEKKILPRWRNHDGTDWHWMIYLLLAFLFIMALSYIL